MTTFLGQNRDRERKMGLLDKRGSGLGLLILCSGIVFLMLLLSVDNTIKAQPVGTALASDGTTMRVSVSSTGAQANSGSSGLAENGTVEPVSQFGGTSLAVEASGNLVYVGEGARLTILDTSDPSNSKVIGSTAELPGVVQDIALVGDYAYIAAGDSGLRIIAVANPTAPYEVGWYDTPGNARRITVEDNTAYVADDHGGLRIIDVSDPASPTEVGHIEEGYSIHNVRVVRGIAYTAANQGSLVIFDLSDLAHPLEIASLYLGWGVGLDVTSEYVFFAGSPSYSSTLSIVKVSDPRKPNLVSRASISSPGIDVDVVGGLAYVATNSGLSIFDVNDLDSPREVGNYNTLPGNSRAVSIDGQRVYIVDTFGGMRIIDVVDPTHPSELGAYDNASITAQKVVVEGKIAYVLGDHRLRVVDTSDSVHPKEVSEIDIGGLGLAAANGHLYITDYGGLTIVDVSDPKNPKQLGSLEIGGLPGLGPDDIAVRDDMAFIAEDYFEYGGGLRVIDISDPTAPKEVGFTATTDPNYDVAVSGDLAYLAGDYNGLGVVSIADPESPSEIGYYQTPGYPSNLTIIDDLLYVAAGQGISIYSIADPQIPTEIGSYQSGSYSQGIYVTDDLAYVTSGYDGLHMIDVADPNTPAEIVHYDTPGTALDVVAVGDLIYVADGYGGLRILRYLRAEQSVSTIAGKVTMQDGTPLQGVDVSAMFGHKDITDASGEYTIDGLEPGTYDIRASQSGFTFAPVSVTVPPSKTDVDLIGVSDYEFDTGFRPQPNGYPFSNGDPGWGTYPFAPASGDFTFLDMQRMFGDDVVCRQPDPSGGACISYKLGPALWNRTVNTMISTGGRCVGMSSTSLLYFDNSTLLPPSYNATNDVPLAVGRRPIAYYAAEQLANPVRSHFREQQGQSTPTGTLDQLKQAIESNDPVILNLRQNFAGHAVTPYALDDRGGGIWRVMVYDNNYPNNANLFVEIDETTDRWRYDPLGWEGLRWTHSLYITPLSLFTGTQNLPFGLDNSKELDRSEQDAQTNKIYLTGKGHLLISDSEGNRVGFVGDDFVNEVSGASAVTFFGGVQPIEPVYELPVDEAFSIQLSGLPEQRSNAQLDIAQFGLGYGLAFRNVTVSPSSNEKLTIAPDGTSVTYKSDSGISEPDIVMAFDEVMKSHQFEILGADVGKGQTIIAAVDLSDRQLVFDSSDSQGGKYSITLIASDLVEERQFHYGNLEIGSGDTHYIDYSGWEEGTGPIRVGVDEDGDGAIDKEFELGEGAGSKFVALPVVLSTTYSSSLTPPVYIYPSDGQVLGYEGDYLFKVNEVPQADYYLWGFFQDGLLVWENGRDDGVFSGSDYAILTGTEAHNRFKRGPVEVWARAWINSEWTEPAIITIYLE